MGCCISKCKPKNYYMDDFSHVQDKLVISSSQQAPKTPIPLAKKISPLPLSPTISSSSSVSSFTCSAISTATGSCSSASSSASSTLSSKDRYFSTEFLWACVKENPHIVRINSIKEASRTLAVTKSPPQISNSPVKPVVALAKQGSPARENGRSTPQKRGRSNSQSTLTRQKSFRKDPDYRLNSPYNYLPSRVLRSPSPSRRFNGDNNNINNNYRGLLASTSKEICSSKRTVGPKVNALNSVSSSQRRENFRVSSPKLNSHEPSTPLKSCLRNRETLVHRISSKIDKTALRAALSSQQENESVTMEEDIVNPLISLDCFIFL
ncbi:pentatricopeptide repeat-containing protein [Hibiscus syriacus]|uniref:Pentatricopeptide repeat-containing protein n=1 Tax=Hibiscus syriacus TaxID=106335 RepID=A0A6A2YYI5_HIBSY|nr:uncharacterized protein LOC120154351 [Hibiscus syriacus]XP_039022058.1 uncharacterized protein LOC120154353 [Hibiscus syriacus]KAE8684505.1 pentatricopeptide repeat-containing protein [Hibiscus syriacus]KAE8684506.1 pentatricopeptide repeat-containing protein [Hibiscus syriacus]